MSSRGAEPRSQRRHLNHADRRCSGAGRTIAFAAAGLRRCRRARLRNATHSRVSPHPAGRLPRPGDAQAESRYADGSRRAAAFLGPETPGSPRLQWWRGRRRRDGWRSKGCALLTAGAAGGRPELARRRFSKRMSSRWSPGQPSVFRSRWESRRPSPRAGSIPSSGWWVGGGFSYARDVFAVPTSPPAGVLPVGARASKPAPRRGVMTGRSERIARTTNPPLLRRMPWQPMLSRFCDFGQRLTRRFALAPIGSSFGTEASITLPWRPIIGT